MDAFVAVFRDQEISIQEQLQLARHFGPLHKHATTPVPREPGLEEVHGASIMSRDAAAEVTDVLSPSNSRVQRRLAPARPKRILQARALAL